MATWAVWLNSPWACATTVTLSVTVDSAIVTLIGMDALPAMRTVSLTVAKPASAKVTV